MPGTGFKYLPRKFLHATCCFIFSNSSWSSIFWKYVMHKKNKQHQKDVLLALPRDSSLASKTCVFCRTQTQHPGTLPEQSKHNERYKIPRRTLACIQIHTPKPSTVHPGSWRPSFLSRAPEKSQAHFTLTTFEVAILFRGAMNFGFPEVPFFLVVPAGVRLLAHAPPQNGRWAKAAESEASARSGALAMQCHHHLHTKASTFFEAVSLLSNCLFSPLHCSFLDTPAVYRIELLVLVSQNNLGFEGPRNF